MSEQLYNVFSRVDSFPHRGYYYRDVRIAWFVHERDCPTRSWKEHIVGYDGLDEGDRFYTEDYLNALFTAEEAQQFLDFLEAFPGTHTSKPVQLPLEGGGFVGVGAQAVAGSTNFYKPAEHEEYTLLFAVWGYYDVRGCDRAISQVEAAFGTDYLKQALACLAIEEPPDEHLRAVAEMLFERGLYVGKCPQWELGRLDDSAFDMNDPIPF